MEQHNQRKVPIILEVDGVKKHYTSRKNYIKADGSVIKHALIKSVDGVSLSVKAGEILGIIGESGCGKSTLGRMLVRLEKPTSGQIRLDGEDAEKLIHENRLNFRRKTQMIFQNPFDAFDPRFKIEKVLTDALKLHKIGKNHAERRQMAIKRLEEVGLVPAESFLSRYPHGISGGQLQRIAILRSMLLAPSVVVADEPVSMLDVSIRAEVINMLHRTVRENKTALIFISHDISTTRYISDRIAIMYLGKIVEIGPAETVATEPVHPYTKALISNCASVDPRIKKQPVKLPGEPPTPIDVPAGCSFAARCPIATEECRRTEQELRILEDGRAVRCMKVSK